MSIIPKISVIIPVYKAEQFIEKCARSLFEQTLDDIEFVFINDCTPDKSFDILTNVLNDYPNRRNQVKIIHNKENKGIAATRNIGLRNSSGEYIAYCDSDDSVDSDMFELMYNKAIDSDADIVWCDYFLCNKGSKKHIDQYFNEDNRECIRAIFSYEKVGPYLWNKIAKRELYSKNNLTFPDGINIREDYIMSIQLFLFANKVSYIARPLYYYNVNETSISKKKLDNESRLISNRIKAMKFLEEFLLFQNELGNFDTDFNIAKLKLKHYILENVEKKKDWIDLYPETNKYICSLPYPLLKKIAMYLASKKMINGYKLFSFVYKTGSGIKQYFIKLDK